MFVNFPSGTNIQPAEDTWATRDRVPEAGVVSDLSCFHCDWGLFSGSLSRASQQHTRSRSDACPFQLPSSYKEGPLLNVGLLGTKTDAPRSSQLRAPEPLVAGVHYNKHIWCISVPNIVLPHVNLFSPYDSPSAGLKSAPLQGREQRPRAVEHLARGPITGKQWSWDSDQGGHGRPCCLPKCQVFKHCLPHPTLSAESKHLVTQLCDWFLTLHKNLSTSPEFLNRPLFRCLRFCHYDDAVLRAVTLYILSTLFSLFLNAKKILSLIPAPDS